MKGAADCANCGELEKHEVVLYSEELRRQKFSISPLYPVCRRCGAQVTAEKRPGRGKVVLLNGTCGSGKSSVAEALRRYYGWMPVDLDCVIQSVKRRKQLEKVSSNSAEVFDEVAWELEFLQSFGFDVALATVVETGGLPLYAELFDRMGFDWRMALLKPDIETAIARCETRTCHVHKTPEKWVRYFYDLLEFPPSVNAEKAVTLDNSKEDAAATADRIISLFS